jgi:hypothetical protein
MPKLSDRSALGGVSLNDDFLHIVRDLQSFRMPLSVLFNNASLPIRVTSGDTETIVFRKNKSGDITRILQAGDFVIWVDIANERMIAGMAIDEVSSYPTDLEDSSKLLRFIDTNPLL